MKCPLTTILAAVLLIALNAQAELTPKEFAQVRAWAAERGYFYEGMRESYGAPCFVFANQVDKVVAWVPATIDTADEAINALIAGAITCRVSWNTAVGEKYLEISSTEGVSPATRAQGIGLRDAQADYYNNH